jgi:cyclic pyranopterin monophosphate synthase
MYNSAMSNPLSHLDDFGKVQMVDVGDKPISDRVAVAHGEVLMRPETLAVIRDGLLKKGDALTVAQIAGIMAAKRTSELVPLCHPIPLSHISVEFSLDDHLPGIQISAEVKTSAQTGVEMEALTAVSIAALVVYDMAKAVEKTMCIQNIRLVWKSGGVGGDYKPENDLDETE